MDEFLSDESSRRHSCIKNITMGVPIGSWITHYDQSMTAFLVTDMLKVGLIVREWQKREEMVIASTMRNVVRKLMTSKDRVVNYVLDLCIYLFCVYIIYAKFGVGRKLQVSSLYEQY